MSDTTTTKRVFYLEQALKKTWKEFNRLKKAICPEGEGFGNKPFSELKDEVGQDD